MENARGDLCRLDNAIRQAKSAGTDTKASEKTYARLSDRMHDAMVSWHTFDMSRVLAQTSDVSHEASAAYTELNLI